MIAELYDPVSGVYRGQVPMTGLGAGAYLLTLLERESPPAVTLICQSWETP